MSEKIKTMGMRVGRIANIEGPQLMFTRKYLSGKVGTFQAVEGTEIFINDILETDKDTLAEIEFYLGGWCTISYGNKVEITGIRDAKVLDFEWSVAFKKQPAKLPSAGGVIGSRG